jgi:hypothetical protein
MRTIKKYFQSFFILGSLAFVIGACNLEDANINPNAAEDASIDVILPVSQTNLVWGINDFAAQSTSSLVQYMTGTVNVQLNVTRFEYLPVNFNTAWNSHFYAGALKDIETIIEKSTTEGATHYRGIAKVMQAMAYGYLVDLWGDVPFSQALNLQQFPQPVFDDAASIYQNIFRILDEAIVDLEASSSTSPSRSDLIFPQPTEAAWRTTSRPKWIKTARALQARYHNHMSKMDPVGSAQRALAAIDAGAYANNDDELKVRFGTTNDAAGPWFGFLFGTFGQNNISVNQFFVNFLLNRVDEGVHDPRLPFYVEDKGGGVFVGTPNGNTTITAGASRVGPYANAPGAFTNICTYAEVKFIESEAAFRLGQFERAANSYNDAVKASIVRVTGSSNPAYEAKFASETAASIQQDGLSKIFTEKYIAMYLQTEAWADWRRSIPAGASGTTSGIPQLTAPTPNGTNGVFPRRFQYPQTEFDNNRANVPVKSITDKVFWDL